MQEGTLLVCRKAGEGSNPANSDHYLLLKLVLINFTNEPVLPSKILVTFYLLTTGIYEGLLGANCFLMLESFNS